MPPFIRVETDNTSPEYRLEARRRTSDLTEDALAQSTSLGDVPLDSKPEASALEHQHPPPPRRYIDGGRGGRRGGGRFGDRRPRPSPRGGHRSENFGIRRASSSSFDSPREHSLGRRSSGSFEMPAESPDAPSGEINQSMQAASSAPSGADGPTPGQKRGYTDAFDRNQASSRGYSIDGPPAASRQRQS